ncbi:MAG: ParA family protein [Proteobacteria bacterium]|nr:ParA family protein [Pseudomonadota bacterium]
MIVTISHQKGGVGKSTILFNLIIEYSKLGNVHVIDLDSQQTITSSIEVRKNSGKDTSNIIIEKVSNANELLNYMQNFDEEELLFIDSGGFDSTTNRIAIAGANIVLTPVSSKFFELLGLQTYDENLEQMEKATNFKLVTNVFLNKITHNAKDFSDITDFINESDHFNLLNTVIRQRVDYENSPASGLSVIEHNKYSKAASEMNKFIEELNNLMLNPNVQNSHINEVAA